MSGVSDTGHVREGHVREGQYCRFRLVRIQARPVERAAAARGLRAAQAPSSAGAARLSEPPLDAAVM